MILCGYNVDTLNICMKEFIIFVCTDSTEIFLSKLRSSCSNYNLPSFFTDSYCAGVSNKHCLLTFFIFKKYFFEDHFVLANSAGPDEMLHKLVTHLGDSSPQRVIMDMTSFLYIGFFFHTQIYFTLFKGVVGHCFWYGSHRHSFLSALYLMNCWIDFN